MSKRSLAASPSTPRKRKPKIASDQSNLDTFFRRADASAKSNSKPEDVYYKAGPSAARVNLNTVAEDKIFARQLAEEDGVDIDSPVRKIGQGTWKTTPSKAKLLAEVIDVDLLDDPPPPSGAQTAKASSATNQIPSERGTERSTNEESHAESSTMAMNPVDLANQDLQHFSLSVDPLDYSLDTCPWSDGMAAPYSFLALTLSTLSSTRSRIIILNTLTNALRTIIKYHPASLCSAVYLLSNSLAPPYEPLELGLGPSIVSKAIQDVSGVTPTALKRLYNTTGDPGDVAFEAKSNVRTLIPHPPLRIINVYNSLLKIARVKGVGAAKQKQSIVQKLLIAAKGEEVRYLVRTLGQNLRVGAVRTSILIALARAVVLTAPSNSILSTAPKFSSHASPVPSPADIQSLSPNHEKKLGSAGASKQELNILYSQAEATLKKVYVQRPNYDHITAALLEVGLEGLAERLPLTVGIPLLPTLGSPTRSLEEIYARLGSQPFCAEYKYDGQRAQIHASREVETKPSVHIFSRHLEDMTDKYPDVIFLVEDIFTNSAGIDSFIMDAEIVAIDALDGSIKSFQELSNRARRDVKLDDVKVSVCVFVFDLMYLNNEILLEKPFRYRRALLRSHLPPLVSENKGAARLAHVQSCESENGREAVEEFWQSAVDSRCEGLMIKLLDNGDVNEESKGGEKRRKKPLPATYEPDKRTLAWLKLKKDYVTGLGDSLDLVPVGAWHGNGRKASWWSPILLAVWDPLSGKLVAVCKCMSGFSDTFYKALRERYPENSDTCARAPRWDPTVDTGGLKPQFYFKPQEVWEIRGADVTISPVSVAALGLVSETRGLSLRFPRFIKIRTDKSIVDASTPEFLANMYHTQQGRGKERGGVDEGDLVDAGMEESEVEEYNESEDES